ncbi:TPA: transcription termination/antitermination protein NusA [Candidatus Uhrbacteria bacterium]|nr:transcription termination/antitermination protein NusA [Candidatus Uhrbacteria bacterium]
MPSPIVQAIKQICEEKGLSIESVLQTIEAALAAAYRKDFGEKNQNIEVEFNPVNAEIRVFDVKTVVEDVDLEELERRQEARRARAEQAAQAFTEARERGEQISAMVMEEDEEEELKFNPKTDMMISEASKVKADVGLGEIIRTELPQPGAFGRMAAMTAKQVITQKLREAEREIVFSEFKEKEGEVLNGVVQRREGRMVLVDLGRITGILRPEDQIANEHYVPGEKVKVFVRQVSLSTRGPEIILSRTAEELVKRIFELEIPEISDGSVQIKAIAREAGSRSKVAVSTTDENLDPIGACIGQRGTRIQTIIGALGGEKIDIIEWSEDPEKFIAHALAPAKAQHVELRPDQRLAVVQVDSDQLSLAIGKGGQNVRLAVRLTGWKINVNGQEVSEEIETDSLLEEVPQEEKKEEEAT